MKATQTERLAQAEQESTLLHAMLWRLSREELDDKNKAARDQVLKILGTASLELDGNLAGHKNDFVAARQLLAHADQNETEIGYFEPPLYSRPPLEVLGLACIRAGNFNNARAAFQKATCETAAFRFRSVRVALAWHNEGERVQAQKPTAISLMLGRMPISTFGRSVHHRVNLNTGAFSCFFHSFGLARILGCGALKRSNPAFFASWNFSSIHRLVGSMLYSTVEAIGRRFELRLEQQIGGISGGALPCCINPLPLIIKITHLASGWAAFDMLKTMVMEPCGSDCFSTCSLSETVRG